MVDWFRMAPVMEFVRGTGGAAIDLARYAVRIFTIVGYGLWVLTVRRGSLPPAVHGVMQRQILFTGIEAIPFTCLIAGLTGLIVAVQAQVQGGALIQGSVIGKLLVVVLVRELGPLVVAMIVIGRSCTAIAAELANMRVAREVDTLQALGVDPFSYLVVPRLAGVALAVMCLTMVFVGVSLGTAVVFSSLAGGGLRADELFRLVGSNLGLTDHLAVAAKTVVPGLVVAAISCVEGLSASGSMTAVPPAVTAAVVRSIAAVFIWDAAVTALLFVA